MAAPSMSGVILRRATMAEFRTLTRFIQRYFAFDHLNFDGKAIRSGLRQLLKSRSIGQAFLVIRNSRPVGYTILIDSFDLEFGGRVAFVTDLYLEPACRRRGIGTEVMKQLEHFCRERGMKTIELQAERRNRAALSFYRRLGFQRHDRVALSKRLKGC
jgi:ribosomal protein S18 acetylase RimI-like enzyme